MQINLIIQGTRICVLREKMVPSGFFGWLIVLPFVLLVLKTFLKGKPFVVGDPRSILKEYYV